MECSYLKFASAWGIFLLASVKLVVGIPCVHVKRHVHHISDIFPFTKMKRNAAQTTNQELHLWANP